MLISDAIRQIKTATHDALDEYSEPRCLDFINHAIQQAASMLIAGGYAPMIKELKVKTGTIIPHNFYKACGMYPIKITGNRITVLDGDEVKFRFFSIPEELTEDDFEMPFPNDAINEVVVKMAIIMALNENEFDVTQDTNIMNQLQQAIVTGMGS